MKPLAGPRVVDAQRDCGPRATVEVPVEAVDGETSIAWLKLSGAGWVGKIDLEVDGRKLTVRAEHLAAALSALGVLRAPMYPTAHPNCCPPPMPGVPVP